MAKNDKEKQANQLDETILPEKSQEEDAVELSHPEINEIQVSHYLDERGILLQKRAEVLKHLGKKPSDKVETRWLDSKMKSYKGIM